ncbi:hypothetical protein, partial [Sutterella wadsworthensis]|uniref:hypothetical protein n=1 Tax=Sutterella wadsworthensis TaxID=40545 RepID=UPI003AF9327D
QVQRSKGQEAVSSAWQGFLNKGWMAGIPTSDIEYSFRTAASYRIRRSIDDSATDGKEFAPSVSSKKKIPGSKVKTGTVSPLSSAAA